MRRTQTLAVGAALLAFSALSSTPAQAGRADVAGYVRLGMRPDFQGGGGTLGYWNLYGRLLNERPYAALELRYDVLERQALTRDPWTSLHLRIEGGNIQNATPDASLAGFRMSQVFARAGNVLLPDVTWQVGTLDTYFGDLGLYDMRPAQIFFETIGGSARWQTRRIDLLLGFGDSGFGLKRQDYNTIFTPGGTLRVRPIDQLEVGLGGMYRYEPKVAGNTQAPYNTPGLDYEDWVRGEVLQQWLAQEPARNEVDFPNPVATDAKSWKLIGYLGFGGFGPVRWNNFFASLERKHPLGSTLETFQGQEYRLYVTGLTDQRTVLTLGDELQLRLVPDRLDMVLAGLYGRHTDLDNTIVPSDDARSYVSTVLRLQTYLTDTVHWLAEGSAAKEVSTNGNAFREHPDSLFANTAGQPDARGLERGDTDTRYTFQGKTGMVLNPLGRGVYTRPSLRFLYGVQYSNQNNAFGNSFVETIDQYDDFENVERHLHHVLSIETEAWF
jgi:hypothetical protein